MAKPVDIEIFKIAETRVNHDEVDKWLTLMGVDPDNIDRSINDPAFLIAMAAKRCYKSFEVGLNPNVTRIRKEYVDYFDNILKSGHGSVLEHSVFSFAIENVSRVFTAEMNRHRAGWAISEGSMRFIKFDDIEYWIPDSLQVRKTDNFDTKTKKLRSQKVLQRAFEADEGFYNELMDIWRPDNFSFKKKITSMARRVVGMGVATGGVWTGNVRALRHVIAMRTSSGAEEEIMHVFKRIADMMIESEPLMFPDFVNYQPKYRKV